MTSQYGAYALRAGLARLHAQCACTRPRTRLSTCTHGRTHRPISNTYCFSTATMIRNVTLNVHCRSCLSCCNTGVCLLRDTSIIYKYNSGHSKVLAKHSRGIWWKPSLTTIITVKGEYPCFVFWSLWFISRRAEYISYWNFSGFPHDLQAAARIVPQNRLLQITHFCNLLSASHPALYYPRDYKLNER
jgi:hypothetical protein